ncbi:Clr5 domain-containing protein [Cladophialophora immunda]|nr:Clr5 domain-containing protein [Cladophialophora immunda]
MDARLYSLVVDGHSSDSQFIPSDADWEGRREDIERLYVTQRRSLKEVILIIEAMSQMYKRRLAKWKLNKNNNKRMTLAILRKQSQRLADGKHTKFFISGREVDMDALMRHAKRSGAKAAQAYPNRMSRSPTPDGLECVTPVPAWLADDDINGSSLLEPWPTSTEPHHERLSLLLEASPDQADTLALYELFRSILRNYITGAYEARMWLCNEGENYCRSSRAAELKTDMRGSERPGSGLRRLLDDSDRENGISSPTSMEYLRAMAFNIFVENSDIEGAFVLAEKILERTRQAPNAHSRDLGLLTALSIQIDAALRSRQDERARHAIHQVLTTVSKLDALDSLHNAALLSRLEDCLMRLGRRDEAQFSGSR